MHTTPETISTLRKPSTRRSNLLTAATLLLALCTAPTTLAIAEPTLPSTPKTMPAPALPPPGTYKIDPRHSFAYFSAWHHMVGRIRGRFDNVTGTITVASNPADCTVDVLIDPSTINTQVTERDQDLRSNTYFDVTLFPKMTYQGHGIHRITPNSAANGTANQDQWQMDGSLTLHGVTVVVPLIFKFNGTFSDTAPTDPARVAFHATAGLKRAAFGIGARDNAAEVGKATAPDVDIEIDIEADATPPTP